MQEVVFLPVFIQHVICAGSASSGILHDQEAQFVIDLIVAINQNNPWILHQLPIESNIRLKKEQLAGVEELCKAACCNLSESFETNPSVDVSYSDAATGAKQIKLLGLSGAYVQMLTENIPALRGIAAPYGLGYIPGPWMESIQVSKGTASVINGYEAVTGQINVEYKKPQSSEIVAANVFASDAPNLPIPITTNCLFAILPTPIQLIFFLLGN